MQEPGFNERDRFTIVPGEDELFSQPRPGSRVIKTVSWPALLLALLAVMGVIALAGFYWLDRQTLFANVEQVHRLDIEHRQDVARMDQLNQTIQQLSSELQGYKQQLDAIPQIEPQRINALEVQTSALALSVQRLNQSIDGNNQVSSPESQSLDASGNNQTDIGKRMDAIESRLNDLSSRVSLLGHNEH